MAAFSDPAGIAGRIIQRQVYAHCITVMYGVTDQPDPAKIFIASAGLVEFDGVVCAVTCYHILDGYKRHLALDRRFTFRIGGVECDPFQRLRDSDVGLDLAILDVTDIPLEHLRPGGDIPQPIKPVRWPPDRVQENELVVACGFAMELREEDASMWHIQSNAFSLTEHVVSVDLDRFSISLRRNWVSTVDDQPAPDDIRNVDFNGWSGAPVFRRRDIKGIAIIEFLGTILSQPPRFGADETLSVRSSSCIGPDGRIA